MTKSTAQLEREAELTRSQLAATLEELRSRITPGQLVDQTLDYARESNLAELMRNLGRDACDNPLPLALIGTGLAWLMMTNGRRRGVDAAVTEATRGASGAIDETTHARGTAAASSAASTAAERASEVYQNATAAGGSLLAFCRDHPLVLAGVGIALGGLLGAALPSRTGEDRPADEPAPGGLPAVRATSAPESSVVPAAPGEAAAI
ncbi:MAG TPA: DUF3618 domain-containing protein [Xanthobacteraceae bacterium]|nr:DUF3618 domain-containing protein [Xanthobacteraceae bacterium]